MLASSSHFISFGVLGIKYALGASEQNFQKNRGKSSFFCQKCLILSNQATWLSKLIVNEMTCANFMAFPPLTKFTAAA